MLMFYDPEIISMLLSLLVESSGYQYQDGINDPQQQFSFLGDTQMFMVCKDLNASS
jgi:hypothetical protein